MQICAAFSQSTKSLDEVIGSIPPVAAGGGSSRTDQSLAVIRTLAGWPDGEPVDEWKIGAALWQMIEAPEAAVRREAAAALGRRNHREYIPALFFNIEKDHGSVGAFYEGLPNPQEDPPTESLRAALVSRQSEVRALALRVARYCNATGVREEVERVAARDPVESVRVAAAELLAHFAAPESLPALRQALRGSDQARVTIALALVRLGTDAEVDLLVPLLKSPSAHTRKAIASALPELCLADPRRAADVLLPLLQDPESKVRIAAVKSMARLRDERILQTVSLVFEGKVKVEPADLSDLARSLAAYRADIAVPLLNQVAFRDSEAREVLKRFQHPSTGYLAWEEYLSDPIGGNRSDGMTQRSIAALDLLKSTADEDVFKALRLRADKLHEDNLEKMHLDNAIEELGRRFPETLSLSIDSLVAKAPAQASDRDGDGVADRRDKYPNDPRRSADIPVFQHESPIPVQTYAVIPLGTSEPASKSPLFMATDDEFRVGWITRANAAEPPDYNVWVSNKFDLEQWPLPNPGDTRDVTELVPLSINSQGTVVGIAKRKKVAIPLRQDIRNAHVTFQSGFIFQKGTLRLDPPAPFGTSSLNVTYRRINNKGLVFGHRELRLRKDGDDVFQKFAFLGEHVFREVALFDVTDMTDKGQLLCYRSGNGKPESFVWDGQQFHDLGSLAGKPDAVSAFALNENLQVVGLSDAVDRAGCPIGFFWEKGVMRGFPDLIPQDLRSEFRSAIPYLISTGGIQFRAETRNDPFGLSWVKGDFVLKFGRDGAAHSVHKSRTLKSEE